MEYNNHLKKVIVLLFKNCCGWGQRIKPAKLLLYQAIFISSVCIAKIVFVFKKFTVFVVWKNQCVNPAKNVL